MKEKIIAFDISFTSTGIAKDVNGKVETMFKNIESLAKMHKTPYEYEMDFQIEETLKETEPEIVLVEDNRFTAVWRMTMDIWMAKFGIGSLISRCKEKDISVYGINNQTLTKAIRTSLGLVPPKSKSKKELKEWDKKKIEWWEKLGLGESLSLTKSKHKKALSLYHTKEQIKEFKNNDNIIDDEADAANMIWLYKNGYKDLFKKIC